MSNQQSRFTWTAFFFISRLVVKGALFASSPLLLGLVIGYVARPNPLPQDQSFYGFLGALSFAACFGGALFYPLHVRTPYGRDRYKPELIELAPGFLKKGWLYPLTVIAVCIVGGATFFYFVAPDPKSTPASNALFGGFFSPILGFSGLSVPVIFEVLREQWKLSKSTLNAGAVALWVGVMLASHPWTSQTKAGPAMATIVIGLLAAALLGQYRL